MGETTGFLQWTRETPTRRPIPVRLLDWREGKHRFEVVNPGRADGRVALDVTLRSASREKVPEAPTN